MDQQSIFEYLDTLQLQITDPVQKQLEYYHDKKNMITSQKKISSPQFRSPQINPLLGDQLNIRKTLSQQTIALPEHVNSLNINSHKKSHFEKRITFQ
ncbi:unnamed protein product [Paramecium sonneborni]|uniref:Uncharacterized protein n=1 Tax=Paramecium sonneborni TaxID=65129 RepID=A0A8S1N427_9CILI|nr:unnamed protein product [Paramecium sonneborni]CAD8084881.1 unnamed protein product [Paramecium sonneborni]